MRGSPKRDMRLLMGLAGVMLAAGGVGTSAHEDATPAVPAPRNRGRRYYNPGAADIPAVHGKITPAMSRRERAARAGGSFDVDDLDRVVAAQRKRQLKAARRAQLHAP